MYTDIMPMYAHSHTISTDYIYMHARCNFYQALSEPGCSCYVQVLCALDSYFLLLPIHGLPLTALVQRIITPNLSLSLLCVSLPSHRLPVFTVRGPLPVFLYFMLLLIWLLTQLLLATGNILARLIQQSCKGLGKSSSFIPCSQPSPPVQI